MKRKEKREKKKEKNTSSHSWGALQLVDED